MNALKVALNDFNGNMTDDTNWVGMTTFSNDAEVVLNFTSKKDDVNSKIVDLKSTLWGTHQCGTGSLCQYRNLIYRDVLM